MLVSLELTLVVEVMLVDSIYIEFFSINVTRKGYFGKVRDGDYVVVILKCIPKSDTICSTTSSLGWDEKISPQA